MAMLNNQMVYIYIYITFLNKMPWKLETLYLLDKTLAALVSGEFSPRPTQTISAAN